MDKIIPEVMLLDLIFDRNRIREGFPDWRKIVVDQVKALYVKKHELWMVNYRHHYSDCEIHPDANGY